MQELSLAAIAICVMIGFFTLVLCGLGGVAYLHIRTSSPSSNRRRQVTRNTVPNNVFHISSNSIAEHNPYTNVSEHVNPTMVVQPNEPTFAPKQRKPKTSKPKTVKNNKSKPVDEDKLAITNLTLQLAKFLDALDTATKVNTSLLDALKSPKTETVACTNVCPAPATDSSVVKPNNENEHPEKSHVDAPPSSLAELEIENNNATTSPEVNNTTDVVDVNDNLSAENNIVKTVFNDS
jgi:hypothetical protein